MYDVIIVSLLCNPVSFKNAMETLLGLPHLHLKEYFKQVDYSYWQRSSRKKDAGGQRAKSLHWSHPPSVPRVSAPPTGSKTLRCQTVSVTSSKQAQLDCSGLSRLSTVCDGAAVSKEMYVSKRNAVADEPPPEKGAPVRMLETLIDLRRNAVAQLQRHCDFLQDRNRQLAREIEEENRSSFSSVRDSLVLHKKLGYSFAHLSGWSCGQTGRAHAELQGELDSTQRGLGGLREQLSSVSEDVQKGRERAHTLRTYRDMQYPVRALTIAKMNSNIRSLKQTLQDEQEGVAALCRYQMEKMEGKYRAMEEQMLTAVATEHLSLIPPTVWQVASQNRLMKKEIKMFKKTIEELELTNQELASDVQELQRARKQRRRAMFHHVFLRADKCTPDMDVVFDVPREEQLPI
ncbi:hypothetical protein GJAV_G00170950 [Gymnothorax javanicus]|nr:hypothetical protein GJAV_G00170950 [Gymnothorax javanicus]